ncbi:MAG: sulfotransferase [Rhodospirillaceae bacterium]|mgnify:CR=1 FL=1|nr:sulfotransferase [Rhodospirillaceae bacterium]
MTEENPETATAAKPRPRRSVEDLLAEGDAALARRDGAAAVATFRKMAILLPNDWRGHERLAHVMRRIGRFDDALKSVERAHELAPDEPRVLAETGYCRRLLGRGDAIECLHRATELAPDVADYHSWLADAYWDTHRHPKQAVASYRRALELDPQNPQRMIRFAGILAATGRTKEAAPIFDRATTLAPNSLEVWIARARFAQIVGRMDEAKDAWRRVIDIAPDSSDALVVLAAQFPEAVDEAMRLRAEALAVAPQNGARSRRQLHFALYSLDRHRGEPASAFEHLREANRLRRDELNAQNRGYDHPSREHYFDRIVETFNRAFFERCRDWGDPSDRPIFILGMPRSGTTLCEQILASHSKVHGGGELESIRTVARLLPPALAQPNEKPGSFPWAMERLSPGVTRRMAKRYLDETAALSKLPRITDKMPSNYVHVGLIHLLFPHARIVHCVRDPMDNALSCFEQNFSHPTSWAWDLDDIGHYYNQYRRLMAHWNATLPGTMLEFSYEATVGDFEPMARRLLEFCGLEWEDACLDFHRTDRPVLTASKGQVRRPIYNSSVAKWRRFETQLEPLRLAIGL